MSATQDGEPFVSPDGLLVIPREYYLTSVALARMTVTLPEGAQRVLDDDELDRLQETIAALERLGMYQATYHEIDAYMAALADGAMDGLEDDNEGGN